MVYKVWKGEEEKRKRIELNPILCYGFMDYLVYIRELGPANKVGGDGGGPKEAGEKYNKS